MTTHAAEIAVEGVSEDRLAATLDAWLVEHLPADWRTAAEAGRWAEVERIRSDPQRASAWFDLLGDAGLATPTWPRRYGGLDLAADRASIVTERLARLQAGRPRRDFVGLALAGPTLLAWGTDEQKERYLPPLTRGREVWCQLFSEPGAGSDLAALATRAVRHGDGSWRVSGQKVWSSYAHLADLGLLMARTDPAAPKHRGITYFLLDMHAPGVQTRPLRQMTGNAEFNEVYLDDVVVPDAARLGPVDRGWSVAMTTLLQERDGLSGRPRVGEGEVEGLVAEATRTGAWADPVLRDRLIAAFVVERALQMTTVRSSVGVGAPGAEGSVRKLAHAAVTERLGALGLDVSARPWAWETGARPRDVERFLALKTYSIAGGTSEIQRNIIAERLLGLPKDDDPERDLPFAQRSRG